MEVYENRGTPKSSFWVAFAILNHPAIGLPPFWETLMSGKRKTMSWGIPGWWFGTFFIFPYIGNNHLNWLIFFRGVQTTNQMSSGILNFRDVYQTMLDGVNWPQICRRRPHLGRALAPGSGSPAPGQSGAGAALAQGRHVGLRKSWKCGKSQSKCRFLWEKPSIY